MDGISPSSLLSEWRWLVGAVYEPVVMTALGDLFLRDAAGQMYFLDLMCGEFKQVALSQEEFDTLCEDRGRRRSWCTGFLVMELRKLHGELAPGECYGCKVPLSLGGQLEPDNFRRTSILTHYSVLGQLQHQTKRLPAGTKIDSIKLEHENTKPKSFWQRLGSWGR
jgi:hypothetical protein